MKIVIAGAGSIGFHLAQLLSKENNDITLIDLNEELLEQTTRSIDVLTLYGDASTSIILEQANAKKADLFIAVTTSEQTNLIAAILAKQLGAKSTIARIQSSDHLKPVNKEKFKKLGIDVLISPAKLASKEIKRLLKSASFTDLYQFEDGKINIFGLTIDHPSPYVNLSIGELVEMNLNYEFRVIALLRNQKTVIPDRNEIIKKGDHLYVASSNKNFKTALSFSGKQLQSIKNVMIIGNTRLALKTAALLESKYNVKLVIDDEEDAVRFDELLDKTLVINGDPSDIELLKEEGLKDMDAFIALTPNSETNIINSLLAEELGVYKTIAQVENTEYTHISQNIGIDTIINKKLIAANNIFRFVRKGKVKAIAGLHGVDAEIIEFVVHPENQFVDREIKEIGFPNKSVIAGVIRNNQSFVPTGSHKLRVDDKVIILCLPDAISEIEQIFQ